MGTKIRKYFTNYFFFFSKNYILFKKRGVFLLILRNDNRIVFPS